MNAGAGIDSFIAENGLLSRSASLSTSTAAWATTTSTAATAPT